MCKDKGWFGLEASNLVLGREVGRDLESPQFPGALAGWDAERRGWRAPGGLSGEFVWDGGQAGFTLHSPT